MLDMIARTTHINEVARVDVDHSMAENLPDIAEKDHLD